MSVVGFLYPPSGSAITQSRMQGMGSQKGFLNNKMYLGNYYDTILLYYIF